MMPCAAFVVSTGMPAGGEWGPHPLRAALLKKDRRGNNMKKGFPAIVLALVLAIGPINYGPEDDVRNIWAYLAEDDVTLAFHVKEGDKITIEGVLSRCRRA
jgi:hypothetical protein